MRVGSAAPRALQGSWGGETENTGETVHKPNVPFEVKSKKRFFDLKTAKAMSEVAVHGDRS